MNSKPKAMLIVKRRSKPMLAAVVKYDETSARKGEVLVSEPISDQFSMADLEASARRLVPQVSDFDVILPMGVTL